MDLFNDITTPISNMCVIMVIAYVLSHRRYYCEILEGKLTFKNKALLILTFGLFSLYAAAAGGMANVRILGPMLAGLLGGPIVGMGAALFGIAYRIVDMYRYAWAAQVVGSAVLATLLAGLSGGLVHKWKKGQLPRTLHAAIFAAGFEVFHMTLTLVMGQWQDTVVELVKRFAIPMIIAHAMGAACFIFVTNNVINTRKNQLEKGIAQRELQKSEERFATAFHFNPSPMILKMIEDGRYIDVNDSFLSMFGYSRAEVVGKKINEMPVFNEGHYHIAHVLQAEKTVRNLEVTICTKAGERRAGLLFSEIVNIDDKPHVLSVFIDITDRKRLEKERLSLAGQMATGIAHEIRNPLTSVRGFLQFLSRKKDLAGYQEYILLTIGELDQINSLISEMVILAENKAIELRPTNLNSILTALHPAIKAEGLLSEKEINIRMQDIPDLPLDEREMRHLIVNLAKNGFEAMTGKGKVTISTYLFNNEVVLQVQDQGTGIEQEVLKRIGTPFFTTKDSGTGLGLAVCYSIAERHKAVITIESSPAGTSILVKFPMPDTQLGSDDVASKIG